MYDEFGLEKPRYDLVEAIRLETSLYSNRVNVVLLLSLDIVIGEHLVGDELVRVVLV